MLCSHILPTFLVASFLTQCSYLDLNSIYLRYMNPKYINTLDIEQVSKILHTHSSGWYNTTD